MDTTQRATPFKENMVLFIGKNASRYTSYDALERMATFKVVGESGNPANTSVENTRSAGSSNSDAVAGRLPASFAKVFLSNSYYKDQVNGRLSHLTFANGSLFKVDERLPVIKWNILPNAKEIQGLKCQKATCVFKGRFYEAWFCPDIPFRNGPWKLGGLPGLIVEAYDLKKEIVFRFTGFDNSTERKVPVSIPADVLPTTVEKLKKYEQAIAKDRDASKGSGTGVGGVFKVDGRLILSSDGKTMKTLKMNNPIELQ